MARLADYFLVPILGAALVAPWATAQIGAGGKAPVINKDKKKSKSDELPTQAHEQLPEPPASIKADATHLSFLTAPLTAHGLLSQQTREALKYLMVQGKSARFVRLRAFVAGTGDLRRVPQLVSELFTEKHLPLPVVTSVQAGLLPMENAQLLLEATLQQPRVVNPGGIRFASASAATAAAALEQLTQSGELLQATCYVPALEGAASAGSGSVVSFVQPQKSGSGTGSICQGVTRASGDTTGAVAGPLVFTGAQMAFGYTDADARLAFERLERTARAVGATLKNAVSLNYYPLSRQLGGMAIKAGEAFLDPAHIPSGVRGVVFEGLPSIDGAFSIEAVAPAEAAN